jgi:hypothetical protein
MNNGGFMKMDCKHLFCTMQKINYFVIINAAGYPSSLIISIRYGYRI